jgi:hypothetical protein
VISFRARKLEPAVNPHRYALDHEDCRKGVVAFHDFLVESKVHKYTGAVLVELPDLFPGPKVSFSEINVWPVEVQELTEVTAEGGRDCYEIGLWITAESRTLQVGVP